MRRRFPAPTAPTGNCRPNGQTPHAGCWSMAVFPKPRPSVIGDADRDPLLPADPLAAANRRIAILVFARRQSCRGRSAAPPPGRPRATRGARSRQNLSGVMLTIGGLVLLFACVLGSYLDVRRQHGAADRSRAVRNVDHRRRRHRHDADGEQHARRQTHARRASARCIKGAAFKKADYIDLLSLLYFLVRLASTKGAMALEPHIEKPDESPHSRNSPRSSPTTTPPRSSVTTCVWSA